MKKLILFLLISSSAKVLAQQDPLHALYLNTPMIVNPAYAGFSRDASLALNFRKQWAGFDGSPSTFNFSGHIAVRENKMGVGLVIMQDKIGSNTQTGIEVTYAYHLPIHTHSKLSFGLQGGFLNDKSDYSQLIIDPNDPKFNSTSEWQPNFGSGIMLTGTSYLLSISFPKMLQPSTDAVSYGLYNRNFYALGAWIFSLSERIRLRPHVLYRQSDRSTSSYDIGISLLGDDSYLVGAFTRSFSTYGVTAQIKVGERMRLGYAFELPTNNSVGINFTTHELQIGFRIRAYQFHDIETVRNF